MTNGARIEINRFRMQIALCTLGGFARNKRVPALPSRDKPFVYTGKLHLLTTKRTSGFSWKTPRAESEVTSDVREFPGGKKRSRAEERRKKGRMSVTSPAPDCAIELCRLQSTPYPFPRTYIVSRGTVNLLPLETTILNLNINLSKTKRSSPLLFS